MMVKEEQATEFSAGNSCQCGWQPLNLKPTSSFNKKTAFKLRPSPPAYTLNEKHALDTLR